MQGPKWPSLLKYGSRDTRCIDFPRVDGLSTDPRVLGRHQAQEVGRLNETPGVLAPAQNGSPVHSPQGLITWTAKKAHIL